MLAASAGGANPAVARRVTAAIKAALFTKAIVIHSPSLRQG